jgi:uncharacterized small protein (TIGR04563 family)
MTHLIKGDTTMNENNSNGAEKSVKSEKADGRKQSLYFPADVVEMLTTEAKRLDRSLSWVVQRCVKEGIDKVRALPSMNDTDE